MKTKINPAMAAVAALIAVFASGNALGASTGNSTDPTPPSLTAGGSSNVAPNHFNGSPGTNPVTPIKPGTVPTIPDNPMPVAPPGPQPAPIQPTPPAPIAPMPQPPPGLLPVPPPQPDPIPPVMPIGSLGV